MLAAKAMVEKLKSSPVCDILADIEKLCVAYIELANWNVEKYKRETSEAVYMLLGPCLYSRGF